MPLRRVWAVPRTNELLIQPPVLFVQDPVVKPAFTPRRLTTLKPRQIYTPRVASAHVYGDNRLVVHSVPRVSPEIVPKIHTYHMYNIYIIIYIHIHTHIISISCMYNSLFHLSYCQGTSPNIMFWTQQTEQRHLRPSVTPSDVEWHPQAPHLKPGEEHKETMGRVEVSVVTHVVILSHPESSWVILSHPESSCMECLCFRLILWMYLSSHLLLISEINQTHTIHTVWSTVPKRPVEAFVPNASGSFGRDQTKMPE